MARTSTFWPVRTGKLGVSSMLTCGGSGAREVWTTAARLVVVSPSVTLKKMR